jgi:hypothetical protein
MMYFKVLRQEIYSRDCFRNAIKAELRRHFEVGVSNYIYEIEPTGFDIIAIRRSD